MITRIDFVVSKMCLMRRRIEDLAKKLLICKKNVSKNTDWESGDCQPSNISVYGCREGFT